MKQLCEEELAPAATPSAPGNPDNKPSEEPKHSYTTHVQDEFDIDDETMDDVEGSQVFLALKPFKIPGLGFQPAGPIPCLATKREDGDYDVVLLLSLVNKRKLTKHLKGGGILRHQGEVKDHKMVLSKDDMEKLKVDGLDSMGGAISAGPPPPLGGM